MRHGARRILPLPKMRHPISAMACIWMSPKASCGHGSGLKKNRLLNLNLLFLSSHLRNQLQCPAWLIRYPGSSLSKHPQLVQRRTQRWCDGALRKEACLQCKGGKEVSSCTLALVTFTVFYGHELLLLNHTTLSWSQITVD